MTEPMIDILLPTFNRAEFTEALLQSIATQDYSEWRIITRDDASTDGSQDILIRWQGMLGEKMLLLPDSGQYNLGCPGNFSRLLENSTASYVMLADPDDIWLPRKIRTSLEAMTQLEDRVGTSRPCLVSTDVSLVDQDLNMIHPSFWAYQGVHPSRMLSMARFLVENSVWGCTILANRALVKKAGSIPTASFHADWWLGLVAATFGYVKPLPVSTVLWRRHGRNTSEASSMLERVGETLIQPAVSRNRLQAVLRENLPRASSFQERYSSQLSEANRQALSAFLSLPTQDLITRRRLILKHRLLFTSFRRNLGLLLLV